MSIFFSNTYDSLKYTLSKVDEENGDQRNNSLAYNLTRAERSGAQKIWQPSNQQAGLTNKTKMVCCPLSHPAGLTNKTKMVCCPSERATKQRWFIVHKRGPLKRDVLLSIREDHLIKKVYCPLNQPL